MWDVQKCFTFPLYREKGSKLKVVTMVWSTYSNLGMPFLTNTKMYAMTNDRAQHNSEEVK